MNFNKRGSYIEGMEGNRTLVVPPKSKRIFNTHARCSLIHKLDKLDVTHDPRKYFELQSKILESRSAIFNFRGFLKGENLTFYSNSIGKKLGKEILKGERWFFKGNEKWFLLEI